MDVYKATQHAFNGGYVSLVIRDGPVASVFGLAGSDENSASAALGWVLDACPRFRAILVSAIFGERIDVAATSILLQEYAEDGGFTDLELLSATGFHAIVEAKVGWAVPSGRQLARYRPRFDASAMHRRCLVSVSAADPAEAVRRLPATVDGVPVRHISWRQIQRHAKQAMGATRTARERLWLSQLITHLEEFTSMNRRTDNRAFVVALGSGPMLKGRPYTWIDVVEKESAYFHPVGRTWPTEPPNYMAFRYRGRLQSVHHVDRFEIVRDLHSLNAYWPRTTSDHFVYRLGPPMRPTSVLKTGALYMNARVWCDIDTLLSGAFTTIKDARDETKRRRTEDAD